MVSDVFNLHHYRTGVTVRVEDVRVSQSYAAEVDASPPGAANHGCMAVPVRAASSPDIVAVLRAQCPTSSDRPFSPDDLFVLSTARGGGASSRP